MDADAENVCEGGAEGALKADAFVKPNYRPIDEAAQKSVKKLLQELGLPENEKFSCAMASVIAAVKVAYGKGSNLIAYPGDSGYYTKGLYSRSIAVAVRDRLVEHSYLAGKSKQRRGAAIVYEAKGFELGGLYSSTETQFVRVRETKSTWQKKGEAISRPVCRRRFGRRYNDEERRIKRINETYAATQLSSPDGVRWGGAFRGFNEGRLDRGGRLYGDWQQRRPEERLRFTIDGEPVVEIDIVASFLFIVSARGGMPIVSKDPYWDIPWVNDRQTRDLAKRLVSAYLSKDGHISSFPKGLRGEFSCIPKRARVAEYIDPVLVLYPQINPPAVSGMSAMYLESEAVICAIEALIDAGIVCYPVHDCLLVAEKHKDEAIRELWLALEDGFGARPWLKVTFNDGREEKWDPVRYVC